MGGMKDANKNRKSGGATRWSNIGSSLMVFGIALLVAWGLSHHLAHAFSAGYEDPSEAYLSLFDTFFQGLAALAAVCVAAYQLMEESRRRKEDEIRKRYDRYYREACLVDAYEAELYGTESIGEDDDRHHDYFVIENNSPNPIRDYFWTSTDKPNGEPVRGPYDRSAKTWGLLSRGRWVIKKNKTGDNAYAWHYPELLDQNNHVVLKLLVKNQPDIVVEGDVSSRLVQHDRAGLRILSLTFTDAYGNTWKRVFDGPTGKTNKTILMDSLDEEVMQRFARPAENVGQ